MPQADMEGAFSPQVTRHNILHIKNRVTCRRMHLRPLKNPKGRCCR
jgi:hypothetical protein